MLHFFFNKQYSIPKLDCGEHQKMAVIFIIFYFFGFNVLGSLFATEARENIWLASMIVNNRKSGLRNIEFSPVKPKLPELQKWSNI